MATQDDRIKGLETQTGNVRERLSKIEGQLEEALKREKPTSGLLIASVSIAATVLIGYLGWLGVQIVDQGRQIASIKALIAPQIIQDAALHPGDPKIAILAAKTVQRALKEGKKIDPSLIANAGAEFVNAAKTNPEAWIAAVEFLNYRSAYNVRPDPAAVPVPMEGFSKFNISSVPGKEIPKPSNIPISVAPSGGAKYEDIGQGLNPKFTSALLFLEGGAVNIDGKEIRDVVFDSVEIHYSGKALILNEVHFIHCTFVLENDDPTRKFGQTLLASSPVDFQTAG